MKVCIPAINNEGLQSEISHHFGSAPWFVLYDADNQTIQAIANRKMEHEHGQCRPMDLLSGLGIVAVVCKGMGRNAVQAIERQGIKVFTADGSTVGDAVDGFLEGRLIKLNPTDLCHGHGCH